MRRFARHVMYLLLLGLFPIWGASAAPVHSVRVTLDDCVRLAAQESGKVAAGGHGIDAALAQLDEAKARGWPVFEYEYRTAPVPQDVSDAVRSFFGGDLSWLHTMKVGIGLPVYAFGKLSIARQLAGHGVDAARELRRKESAVAVAQARQLYYGIQFGDDMIGLLEEADRELTKKIDEDADDASAEARDPDAAVDTSKTAPVEKLRLRILRTELRKRLDEAHRKRRLALAGLRIQLGFPERTTLVLDRHGQRATGTQLHSVARYLDDALAARPDARLVATGREAKRLEYELTRKEALPNIGVGGFFEVGRTIGEVRGLAATDDFNDPFNFTRAGVGVQLKGRFDPHGGSARTRRKQSEYYKVRTEAALAREGIGLEVQQAWLEAVDARTHMHRAEGAAKDARRLLFLTKSNLDIGVGEQAEYGEALKTLLLTQGQYYESIFQWNSALAKLDEKIGVTPYASE